MGGDGDFLLDRHFPSGTASQCGVSSKKPCCRAGGDDLADYALTPAVPPGPPVQGSGVVGVSWGLPLAPAGAVSHQEGFYRALSQSVSWHTVLSSV